MTWNRNRNRSRILKKGRNRIQFFRFRNPGLKVPMYFKTWYNLRHLAKISVCIKNWSLFFGPKRYFFPSRYLNPITPFLPLFFPILHLFYPSTSFFSFSFPLSVFLFPFFLSLLHFPLFLFPIFLFFPPNDIS